MDSDLNELLENFETVSTIFDVNNSRRPKIYRKRPNYFESFDETDFFRRYRLGKSSVLYLLEKIEHDLEFPDNRNNSVSPINQLLIALRFYATGNHLLAVADMGGISVATCSRIIKRVSKAILALRPEFVKFPNSSEEQEKVKMEFYNIARFPNVLGCIDCTHVKIQSPGGDDAELFRNRKGYMSINVQTVASANLLIRDVVARWPGSTHDSAIYQNSDTYRKFERGDYSNSYLLGDSGYPLKIKEEPLTPLGACVACASTALAAQEFRLFVRNSQKLWRKALINLAALPNTMVSPVKSVCVLVKADLSMQTFKDYNSNDPKTILNRLKNRVVKKPVDRKPRGARTGPSCCCPDCGKSFLSPYYLNMHLRNSGHKEACLVCGSVFVRGKEMQEHLSSVHNEISFLCKKCPILCTNEMQLKNHVKKAHKTGALTCTDCGRTFPRNASFESHSQMHAVRTCRACGVQFTNRGCYREHRSQCEPDAKPNAQDVPRNRRSNIRDPATFTCDHCGKTYNSRPQLKNHILWIHMDIRPHQCQWCGKRFYTPARLAEHTVVHTRVRNFECDICGAKLVSKMAAVYHRRRHTGERPYECEDCGEKFISASRRSEHAKRRHNKGYRLPCSKCPANFVRKHELKKHMDKAHKENVLVWPE